MSFTLFSDYEAVNLFSYAAVCGGYSYRNCFE